MILGWQLFFPGFIGLADNGDFPKITGRLCLGVAPDFEKFTYFFPTYERAVSHCWNSEVPSSELKLAKIAWGVERHTHNPRSFDIRWLGAVHALLFLAVWWMFLIALRPARPVAWWVCAIVGLFIFTDVSYIAYLNSFFTDTPAIPAAIGVVAGALFLVRDPKSFCVWLAFTGAGLLLVTSKAQHGIPCIFAVAFALMLVFLYRNQRSIMAMGLASALTLAIGIGAIVHMSPSWYQNQPRFNVIFLKLLPNSNNVAADAAELGLAPEDIVYKGMGAYQADSPIDKPGWIEAFAKRGSYKNVAFYWLRRPSRAFGTLWQDLREWAPEMRPNLANFPREAGLGPDAKTKRFAAWSEFRSALLKRWPAHMIAWYALILVLGVVALFADPSRFRQAVAAAALLAACMGITEFAITSLLDALETYRHLLLFHLYTDLTVVLALLYLLDWFQRKNTIANPMSSRGTA